MSTAIQNANVMAILKNRFGIVPNYEDILEATYRLFIEPGQTVVDIGAHTGRHTQVFSDLAGPEGEVHAFEPLPWAFQILSQRGLSKNVYFYNFAIAQGDGTRSFVFAKGAPEESGFREKQYNNPGDVTPEKITVATRSLDSFSFEIGRVNFIKIDAEGAELECIRSASELIRTHRPFITVEYGYPSYSVYEHNASSLFHLAVSIGYVIGDMFGAYCADLASWSRICDVAYWDWFLIPLERIDEWQAKFKLAI